MSKSGERLIKAANDAAELARRDVDACMLQSMATALRSGLYRSIGFSFNDEDMADLLERVSAERMIAKADH
ncbi:MAG: hypothetical protein AAF986_08275 [Pseudomonadota bacterium]